VSKRDLTFKGWDWTELLRVWPESKKVKWPKDTKALAFAKEEAQAKWLTERISKLSFDEPSWELRQCRRFAQKCASVSPHTCKSVMEAVANTPCDYTFTGWLSLDIRRWWT
jgi:hypothetical protein